MRCVKSLFTNIQVLCKKKGLWQLYKKKRLRWLLLEIFMLVVPEKGRSSRPLVFCKKGVLKNFAKIHRKTPMSEPFFNKVAGLGLQLYLKKGLWHKCFPVNFEKFLRKHFLTEHLQWLPPKRKKTPVL